MAKTTNEILIQIRNELRALRYILTPVIVDNDEKIKIKNKVDSTDAGDLD